MVVRTSRPCMAFPLSATGRILSLLLPSYDCVSAPSTMTCLHFFQQRQRLFSLQLYSTLNINEVQEIAIANDIRR